jgi:RNA polymerase sigma-70 factor, ECF subfamily
VIVAAMDPTLRSLELMKSGEILAGLLSQIARNDEQAMAELYDRTRHIVYGLVLRMLRERTAAEDTTQEIYMLIWRKAEMFDPARGSAMGWIVTLSRNRALDKMRSSKAILGQENSSERLDAFHSPDPDPEQTSAVSERAQLVHRSLALLPPDQRRVLEMAFFDGLSQSEIASRTALPLGTVKTRIRIGMRRLREQLSVLDNCETGDALTNQAAVALVN